MLFIDIIIALLIGAIIFNLYFFHSEYIKKISTLWRNWSKDIFNRVPVTQRSIEQEFYNEKDNDINSDTILENQVTYSRYPDASNSALRFFKPKVVYKHSSRAKVIKNTQTKYHVCAICGKLKTKD